jgi:cytochrome c-type biogenesis protein CcmH
MKRIVLLTFVLLTLLLVFTIPVYAQDGSPNEPTDDEVNAIAKQMYCPVCENTPLDVCPTQACAEWRELIRDKLTEGWSEQQIKDYFVAQFGDRVLAEPPAQGLNWLVYLIPPLAFLAGAFVLYRAFRSWQNAAPEPAEILSEMDVEAQSQSQDDMYISRLENELENRS